MIYPRVPCVLECQVLITASGLPKSSGTLYAYIWRQSDGYYLTSSATWQAAKPTTGGGTLPTATYKAAGIWYYTLATTVTDDLAPGDQVTMMLVDNETEASVTTNSSPVTHTVDLMAAEVRDVVESQRGHHTQQSSGPTIYVGPVNGNDTTGNGSRLLPYKTVTKALSVITTGTHSTVFILADQGSGTTTLTEDITVNKRYTFIRGPGRDLIIKASSSNTPTFTVTANGVELSGFQLESHATGANAHGISASAADFLHVHSVYVNATQGTGITLANCSNARISQCTFQGTGVSAAGHGLVVASSAGSSCSYNTVCDNVFRDVQGDAIRLTHTGGGTHDNSYICRNSIDDSTAYGINVGSNVTHTMLLENSYGNNASGDVLDNGTGTHFSDPTLNALMSRHITASTVGAAINTAATSTAPTAAAIADAVLEELVADHSATSGSLAEAVANLGTGPGDELLTVTLLDSLAAAIQGAAIYAHNASGLLVGTGTTNSSGVAVLTPGTGVMTVSGHYAGYTIPSTTATISNGVNQTASLTGTAASTPSAGAAGTCVMYMTLLDSQGAVVSGVSGTCKLIKLPQEISSAFVSTLPASATSGADGVISWTVPQGAVVRVYVPDYFNSTTLTAPASATVDISTLV